MNIVFMGTPDFAVASLDLLIQSNFNVVAVITAPDKPAGRGQVISQSAVKKYAIKHQLKVLQPMNLKDPLFLNALKALKADLQLVVAFRMLPEVVWNMPALGTYNLHASLLPKYRGAAPINWAIINGDTETGISTFKLKHEIDTGHILLQEKQSIGENTTAGELHDQLMIKGAALLVKTVQMIEKSLSGGETLHFLNQDDTIASHAPKLNKENCRINWQSDVKKTHNLVRGLSPYPSAYTSLEDEQGIKMVKLFEVDYALCDHHEDNGSLYTDNDKILRAFGQGGYIEIKEIQLEGKKRMPVADFLRGYKIKKGAKFI